MAKIISACPSCGTQLKIATLHCDGCGLDLKNDFELSPFETLSQEQNKFLLSFLRQQGNLSAVQKELEISYPTAKKRLDDLLTALRLSGGEGQAVKTEEVIDMSAWVIPPDSKKASDVIKRKLRENGGRVTVYTARGLSCEICAAPDGETFTSDKLPAQAPWRYEVFDVIVDLLRSRGGRAKKGNARNNRLGDPGCDETTVAGAIGYRYFKAETGKSVFDPVFALAAVLEWAGIVINGRGELILTEEYR